MVKDGIDVSQYQGIIDWEKTKEYIDFAILRVGYGQDLPAQDDQLFKVNADECTRLNIPFGVYLYSYAQNEQDALSEAKHVLRLIKEYNLSYPVYLDLEDAKIGRLTNQQIEKNARVFLEEIEKNGYIPGVYASYYWWRTKLTTPLFSKYTRWVARYADELGAESSLFDLWQYSDKGFVAGINGPVDLDYAYKEFKEVELSNDNEYKVGDKVKFSRIYTSSESTIPLIPFYNEGTITRVIEGANNPYLISNGLGWINRNNIIKE